MCDPAHAIVRMVAKSDDRQAMWFYGLYPVTPRSLRRMGEPQRLP
jgi:hypothetical protein